MLCSRMLYKDRIGFLSCQRYLMLKITQNILEAREKTTVAPVISLFRQLSISRIDHRHQSGNWTLNGSNPHDTQPWPSVLCFTFSPAHVVVVPWATSSVCLISSLYRSRLHSWSYSDRSVDGSICISPPRSEHTHTQWLFPDVFNNFLKAASSLLHIDHRVRQFISSPAKRNDCLVKFCLRKQDGRGNSLNTSELVTALIR